MQDASQKNKPHKFQNYSWSDLPTTGIRREFWGPGWMKQHDLAVEAHEHTEIPFEWWRDMISACFSGLPINITFRGKKVCVIIDQILSYRLNTTANMYVHYWGFSHPISLKELQGVSVPQAEFLDRKEL